MASTSMLLRRALEAVVSLAAAGAALLAVVAGFLAAAWPGLDVINHVAPYCFLGSLAVLGLAWSLWRRRIAQKTMTLLTAGFAVLAFAAAVAPEVLAGLREPEAPPASAEETITVVSLNAWQGGVLPEAAMDYLIASEADFIVMQETGFVYRPALARLRAAYPYVIESIASPYAQVAIFSRHPPHTINAVAADAWDLAAAGGAPRDLRWTEATFFVDGAPLHLVGLHASRAGGVAATAAELDALSRVLSGVEDPSALIVAGDFNMTPWTHTLRRFARRAHLTRTTHNLATYPTPARGNPDWPPFALFPIDHQFSGGLWRAVSARRGPNVGSDHYPVEVVYQRVAAP